MKDVVNNFKNQIIADGVSKSDVILLEDTLGEKIISSNINIKSITTERSELAVPDILNVLEHYVPETTNDKQVYTTQKYFSIYNDYVVSLQKLSKILADLSTSYNEDKKNTLFNLKCRWTWIPYDGGSTQTAVYDLFSKKHEMTQILRSESFINEACGDKAEYVQDKIKDFLYHLDKNHENTNVSWEIGGFDTFITLGLIVHEEVTSYINSMAFTPTKFSGEDLINFLDNSYTHYEYISEISKYYRKDYINTVDRASKGENVYLSIGMNSLERVEFLTSKNNISINFLDIVKTILNSMSNL